MSKGRFSGSIRLGGVAAVVLAAAWVGCNGWQGVSTENANSPPGASTLATPAAIGAMSLQ